MDSGNEHDELFPPDSHFHTKGRRGIPIGNLTSQLFANIYLHQADMFVKQRLKIRYYVRYMDDILLFHHDKRQLREWQTQLTEFLYEDLYLSVNPRKVRIYPVSTGVDFVGYVIYKNRIRLRTSTLRAYKKRYRRLLKGVAAGTVDAETAQASFLSWQAYAAHANANKVLQNLATWTPPPQKLTQLTLWDIEEKQ